MKPSARVALIFALITASVCTADTYPIFGGPTYHSSTGEGYVAFNGSTIWLVGKNIVNDGTTVSAVAKPSSSTLENAAVWRANGEPLIYEVDGQFDKHNIGLSINNSHEVGGRAIIRVGNANRDYAAKWSASGVRTVLPTPDVTPDNEDAIAYEINDSGELAGEVNRGTGVRRAVKWDAAGNAILLPTPTGVPANAISYATSINNAGQAIGSIEYHDQWIPTRWESNGTPTRLSMTMNIGYQMTTAEALRINRHGQSAGVTDVNFGEGERPAGVFWDANGDAVFLQDVPGVVQDTQVLAISDAGYVVGRQYVDLPGAQHYEGALWTGPGAPVVLQPRPGANTNYSNFPLDVNALGYSVGQAHFAFSEGPEGWPAIWKPNGEIIMLHSLMPVGSPWTLAGSAFVSGITNTGWITGKGGYTPSQPDSGYQRNFTMLLPFAGTYGMGDANFDESIDFADLLIVAQNYGTQTNGSFDVGDFNLDGSVNFTDLLAIAQNYGNVLGDATGLLPNSPNPTFESDWQAARAMVPEPNFIGGLIGVGLMLRRRR